MAQVPDTCSQFQDSKASSSQIEEDSQDQHVNNEFTPSESNQSSKTPTQSDIEFDEIRVTDSFSNQGNAMQTQMSKLTSMQSFTASYDNDSTARHQEIQRMKMQMKSYESSASEAGFIQMVKCKQSENTMQVHSNQCSVSADSQNLRKLLNSEDSRVESMDIDVSLPVNLQPNPKS